MLRRRSWEVKSPDFQGSGDGGDESTADNPPEVPRGTILGTLDAVLLNPNAHHTQ